MSKFYNSATQTFDPIPKAPLYVLSNDSFMSGWGPTRNKTNVCVVPCATLEDAERVEYYLKNKRTDQKYVRIVSHKPKAKAHVVYSLLTDWIETSKRV